MSCVKTFITDYLEKNEEIYIPTPIKYIIYNSQTNQFYSTKMQTILEIDEHLIETSIEKKNFTIFISHPNDEEYLFIECDIDNPEEKIYDYYDFYDIRQNELNIIQEYSIFIDCESNVFDITRTKYSSHKKIDSFEVIYFNNSSH